MPLLRRENRPNKTPASPAVWSGAIEFAFSSKRSLFFTKGAISFFWPMLPMTARRTMATIDSLLGVPVPASGQPAKLRIHEGQFARFE
jgi:hypothetical protein